MAASATGLSSLGALGHSRAEESLTLGAEGVDVRDLIQEERDAWMDTGSSGVG